MKEAFKKKSFSQEEIDEMTAYIQDLVDNKTFEEVNALAKTSWLHVKMVTYFFMLPKTELHQAFKEKFVEPAKDLAAKYLEWKLIGEMKQNKQLFIKEHGIDSYQYNDVKYQIVDRYFIGEWRTADEIIQISIPYFSSQAARDKFWYWIIIYRSKCPEFFDRLVSEMKVYDWNAALTSNRK